MQTSQHGGVVSETRMLRSDTRFVSIRLEDRSEVYIGNLPLECSIVKNDRIHFDGVMSKGDFRGVSQLGLKHVFVFGRTLDSVSQEVFVCLVTEHLRNVGTLTARKLYSLWGSSIMQALQKLQCGDMTPEDFGLGPSNTPSDMHVSMETARMVAMIDDLDKFFKTVLHSVRSLGDLFEMGFSMVMCKKVLTHATHETCQAAVDRIKANPYRMLKYAKRFGEVDDVCLQNLGFEETDDLRIQALPRCC